MAVSNTIVRRHVRAIKDHVLIQDMNFKERKTKSGIILQTDDGKDHGIRPRWGRVYAIGPLQEEVKIGDWILVEHGRWTRGVEIITEDGFEATIRRVDNKDIMGIHEGDAPPEDELLGHIR